MCSKYKRSWGRTRNHVLYFLRLKNKTKRCWTHLSVFSLPPQPQLAWASDQRRRRHRRRQQVRQVSDPQHSGHCLEGLVRRCGCVFLRQTRLAQYRTWRVVKTTTLQPAYYVRDVQRTSDVNVAQITRFRVYIRIIVILCRAASEDSELHNETISFLIIFLLFRS